MTSSMTGFGRSIHNHSRGKTIVEIQSVNRKYLEVFVSLPKEWSRFENEVRKRLSQSVVRGQVSVRISLVPNPDQIAQSIPDKQTLQALKLGWEELAESLGYEKNCIDLAFLLNRLPLETGAQEKKEDFSLIETPLLEAIQLLNQMRKTEGAALAKEISNRLKHLQDLCSEVEKLAPELPNKMRKRLKERMEEILQPSAELDDRLLREAALLSEKVDIAEELARLHSHFAQFSELLSKPSEGGGRKMDFLIQEMGREINTIGSKAMDAAIAHFVVEMKGELEKIREQVQNIE